VVHYHVGIALVNDYAAQLSVLALVGITPNQLHRADGLCHACGWFDLLGLNFVGGSSLLQADPFLRGVQI